MTAPLGTSLQHYNADTKYAWSIDADGADEDDAPMPATAAIPPPLALQAESHLQQDLRYMNDAAIAKAQAEVDEHHRRMCQHS